MTIGDRQPPEFKRGQVLTAAALNQLAQSVAAILNRFKGNQVQGEILTGKLDADLNAATSFATSPGTALLSVWVKDSSGDYTETTRNGEKYTDCNETSNPRSSFSCSFCCSIC